MMKTTVKWADGIATAVSSKMDIDGSRINGMMSKQVFNCNQISAVFIKMSTKAMAEGMAVNTFVPANFSKVVMYLKITNVIIEIYNVLSFLDMNLITRE
jgi:hypothetical protein